MIAFLHTLTDESFFVNPKWSDPFTDPLIQDVPVQEVTFQTIIQPNPMLEQATILFENPNEEKVNLNVYSVDGKMIYQTSSNGEQITLDKAMLAAGTYFLEMRMNSTVSKQKLVVQ